MSWEDDREPIERGDEHYARPSPRPDALAAVRADLGDRDSLLAQARVWAREDEGIEALVAWLDELLTDPAPEGLSEDRYEAVEAMVDGHAEWLYRRLSAFTEEGK